MKKIFAKSKTWLEQIELFLISGPFLLGWVFGILRYQKESPRFALGFQNFLTLALFLLLLTLVYLAQKITLFPVEVLYIAQSVLSVLYITGNLTVSITALLQKKIMVAPVVQSLLDKVYLIIEESVHPIQETRP